MKPEGHRAPSFVCFFLASFVLHFFLLVVPFKREVPRKFLPLSLELVNQKKDTLSAPSPGLQAPEVEPIPKPTQIPRAVEAGLHRVGSPRRVSVPPVREIKVSSKGEDLPGTHVSDIPRLPEGYASNTFRKEGLSDYLSKIRERLERAKVYPLKARIAGYEGVVEISFSILQDGRVSKIEILSSSGYAVLDKAAVKTVEKASPFPPLPGAFSAPLQVSFKMTFRLKN